MKALTLHQPWASLVAIGAKRIETRSWSTDYRGPLAIHAGKRRPPMDFTDGEYRVGRYDGFILVPPGRTAHAEALPLGAIVATCALIDVRRTEDCRYSAGGPGWWMSEGYAWVGFGEQQLGDFFPGRFAWLLADVRKLVVPLPATGHQRLWEWG